MGMLNWITQGCDSLTSAAAPSIDALGVHICIALATIMLVWFGVQEALASAQGGPGFGMGKFLNFFMLITFAYVMVIEQERKGKIIQTYVQDSTLPYVDVEVKNVALDDLRESPYSARIEFEKVYTNPSDHTELKRERWTASVTYVFSPSVRNSELAVNPLGLTIVRFRADQAFS
jgi:hypothetical protein